MAHFELLADAEGWDDQERALRLITSLRGPALGILAHSKRATQFGGGPPEKGTGQGRASSPASPGVRNTRPVRLLHSSRGHGDYPDTGLLCGRTVGSRTPTVCLTGTPRGCTSCTSEVIGNLGPPWYSGTMRALGSVGSPSARVRILSTVRV
ncbi:hypothetical protein E2C01_043912 [Portunus trituberculatus]|uniref:Uncharacterized protein n=1 Tax=Portunus trituberculatus TaxID=210409 RepID=A0A5B7FQP0_PORTR|nr:hypothetical protein [Portunus trituberculatus]